MGKGRREETTGEGGSLGLRKDGQLPLASAFEHATARAYDFCNQTRMYLIKLGGSPTFKK